MGTHFILPDFHSHYSSNGNTAGVYSHQHSNTPGHKHDNPSLYINADTPNGDPIVVPYANASNVPLPAPKP